MPNTILTGFWWPGNTMFTHDNFFVPRWKNYICLQNKTLWEGYIFKRYFEVGIKRYAKYTDRYNKAKLDILNNVYDVLECYYNDCGQLVHYNTLDEGNSFGFYENLTKFTCLINCYSRHDGSYIGIPEDAWFYYKKGLIGLQSIDEKFSGNPPHSEMRTSLMGYQPDERKWYGWARGMAGFEIGSTVKKGDIGYRSEDPQEIYDDLIKYHPADELIRMMNGVHIKVKTYTYRDVTEEEINLGMALDGELVVDESKPVEISTEVVYCGKGEWTAKTLEDAKEMARDFATGCA